MKKTMKNIVVGVVAAALVATIGICGCTKQDEQQGQEEQQQQKENVTLTVYAANSLSKAMPELQAEYVKTHSWVTFNDGQYKSSGDLVTMLTAEPEGADLLITASKGSMDNAEKANLIKTDTRVTMYVNDLVIVAAADSPITSVTLADVATGQYTVAVGDDSVPAGNYANQSLSTVGCFNDPEGKTGADSAGKANGTDAYAGTPLEGMVVTATSVGNVCKTVSSGEAEIAFVYTSDVYRFDGVKVVGTVDVSTHKNIIYPGAVCATSEAAEDAQDFLTWCYTDAEAIKILQNWGFEVSK